jgi:hypothetical protein
MQLLPLEVDALLHRVPAETGWTCAALEPVTIAP